MPLISFFFGSNDIVDIWYPYVWHDDGASSISDCDCRCFAVGTGNPSGEGPCYGRAWIVVIDGIASTVVCSAWSLGWRLSTGRIMECESCSQPYAPDLAAGG